MTPNERQYLSDLARHILKTRNPSPDELEALAEGVLDLLVTLAAIERLGRGDA
jgi:hypothetical protein